MKKIFLIIGIVIIVFGAGIYIYLKKNKFIDFAPQIKAKLQTLVLAASDSLYKLEFDTLDADVLKSKLIIKNLRLLPDTAILMRMESKGEKPADVFKLTLNSLVVDGLNVEDFTSAKEIGLDVIYVKDPHLEIYHEKKSTAPRDSTSIKTLYQNISKEMNSVGVKKLLIQNMNLIHHNFKNKADRTTRFNKTNILFTDILIDSVTQYDNKRFLYSKDALITFVNMKVRTPDSLYFIKFDSIGVNAAKKNVHIEGINVQARYGRDDFVKKLSFAKEMYDVQFKNITFSNIDWWSMVSSESFEAERADVMDCNMKAYTDRSLPPYSKSKVGNYPHQLLMKLPIPVHIKEMKISNFNLMYEEFNPKSRKKGKLEFNNINGTVSNITNEKEIIEQQPLMKIHAEGQLMRTGQLKAEFSFNLAKATQGIFSLDIHLGAMDGSKLNSAAIPLGIFEVKSANIKELNAHISGSNYKGTGFISFKYTDLNINILKQNSTTGQFQKRGFISFIANNLLLKTSNPEDGGFVKKEAASYPRNIHQSFFNVIWKTILIGILKSIGYEAGVDKVK